MVRRAPRQARSQALVERVLAAASALIGEQGSDRVTMSEIARASGVSMGSLYAYFDGKPAIIAALSEQMMGDINGALVASLAHADSAEDAIRRMVEALDAFHGLARDNPVWHHIWVGLQADKELQQLDVADSLANGERVAALLQRFVHAAHAGQLPAAVTLLLHLTGASVRLAAAVDRSAGDAIVDAWRSVLTNELHRLLAPGD